MAGNKKKGKLISIYKHSHTVVLSLQQITYFKKDFYWKRNTDISLILQPFVFTVHFKAEDLGIIHGGGHSLDIGLKSP